VDDAAGVQLWELMEGEVHTALETAGALLTSALRFCTPEECGWVPVPDEAAHWTITLLLA
jgi:hypothetical protein